MTDKDLARVLKSIENNQAKQQNPIVRRMNSQEIFVCCPACKNSFIADFPIKKKSGNTQSKQQSEKKTYNLGPGFWICLGLFILYLVVRSFGLPE